MFIGTVVLKHLFIFLGSGLQGVVVLSVATYIKVQQPSASRSLLSAISVHTTAECSTDWSWCTLKVH